MHKNTLIATFLFILLASFVLAAQEGNRKASLKSIIGEVKIRRGSSPKWLPARPNMPLRPKDAVRTFVESEAVIRTSEGTIIKLGENATFEIQKLSGTTGGASKTSVKILTGSLAANVKKLVGAKSSFEFETPTAVAAIRGTKLGIDVKDSKTSVKVYEGKVYVKPVGADKGAEVKADQMTTVAKGQRDVKVEKMTEEDKKEDIINTLDTIVVDSVTKEDSVSTDTTAATEDSAKVEGLTLSIGTPTPGQIFNPGAMISVSGKVTNGDVKLSINGKDIKPTPEGMFKIDIKAPLTAGDHEIIVEASYGGKNQTIARPYSVKSMDGSLFLNIDEPQEGQEIPEPLVKVRGRTTPGAEVSVAGSGATVAPDGSFRSDVPIPDEEGDVSVDIEATLGSKSINKTVNIKYKAPEEDIDLIIAKPVKGFISCDGNIVISARVRPLKATVTVNGQPLNNGNGDITGMYKVSEDVGDLTLDFEVETEKNSKVFPVDVKYDPVGKSCNTKMPEIQPGQLPLNSKTSNLYFTVFDGTPGDNITFNYTVDGSGLTTENGINGSRFILPLEEGKHTYSLWAEDMAGNKSNVVNGSVIVMTKPPVIRLDEPSTNYKLLHIPPPAPGRPDTHLFDLSFSVENLPDDNGELLNEIIVQVVGGETKTKNKFYNDNDFDFNIKLNRGRNTVNIIVKDKNDRQVQNSLVIEIR